MLMKGQETMIEASIDSPSLLLAYSDQTEDINVDAGSPKRLSLMLPLPTTPYTDVSDQLFSASNSAPTSPFPETHSPVSPESIPARRRSKSLGESPKKNHYHHHHHHRQHGALKLPLISLFKRARENSLENVLEKSPEKGSLKKGRAIVSQQTWGSLGWSWTQNINILKLLAYIFSLSISPLSFHCYSFPNSTAPKET